MTAPVLALLLTQAAWGNPGPSAAVRLGERYLDGLLKAKPHLATFMGDHRFDGELPDRSAAALARREKELVALQKEVGALSREGFSADDKIDADIVADAIALELLYLREIKDWEWDPRLHDSFPYYDPREIVAGRLADVMHGDFAPEAERRASVRKQLAALSRFLAQTKAAAKHPPREYLDQAIKDNKGRIEFFETELKAWIGKEAAGERAWKVAVAALRDYQKFLETDLAKRADGDWRLGRERYEKKFPLALQTSLKPDEAVARAEAAFADARRQLHAVARKLHAELWPKEKQPPVAIADGKAQAAVINRVKDEIAKDHPKPDELVAAHGRNLDAMRAFIEKHDLCALPARETLVVEPMPAFKRGSSAAEYLAPGALDPRPSWKATYYVDPIDPTWPPDRVESYLRGQNDYEVQLVAIHEAYPGHHAQYSYARKAGNPLRAVLWNAAMVEGWAVYGESLMVAAGWGGSKLNDRFKFYDLRGQMVVASNLIIDVKLQTGRMTDAEAVRFMVEEGFQEQAMAEKKLLRAKLDSTQLAQYFLGHDEIKTLERDARKKLGPRFSQRAFDDALIGHGSIAVKFLRRFILGE